MCCKVFVGIDSQVINRKMSSAVKILPLFLPLILALWVRPGLGVKPPGVALDRVRRLELNVKREMNALERRLTDAFTKKLRQQNNTSSLFHVERFLQRLSGDLAAAAATEERKEDAIEQLQRRLAKQERRLHHVNSAIRRLQHTASSAKGLSGARGSSEGRRRGGVTPRPFVSKYPADCQDVYLSKGMKYPGSYVIVVQSNLSPKPFKVRCRQKDNAGWTVIQRRLDGSVDFYRGWEEYKRGFGNMESEFWLGNEYIYELTNQGDYKLRIEMTDWDGKSYWVEYSHFRLGDEANKYSLHAHGYSGTAGDSLTADWVSHNNLPFSTKDNDNDKRFYDNCAKHYHGAWWFNSCFESHLNGVYYHRGAHRDYFVRNGIQWNALHAHASLKQVTMMITPNPNVSEENQDELRNDLK